MFNRTAEDLHRFNEKEPSQQREVFLAHFAAGFEGLGYSQVEATRLAGGLLPDILPYDYDSSAGFPNRLKLTDDVVDTQLPLLTHGRITTDMVGPHTDYLAVFPYLGSPH
jgi:hypothetical protein